MPGATQRTTSRGWGGGGAAVQSAGCGRSEPAELGCDETRARFGLVGAELSEQRSEQARAHEVGEQVGCAWLVHRGA